MNLITVEIFYVIIGVVFTAVAWRIARDGAHRRRWGSALFWTLLAVVYLFGKVLPPVAVGYLVLALVGLAATRQVQPSEEHGPNRAQRTAEAERLGNRLFWPALLVPLVAVVGTLSLGRIHWGAVALVDAKQVTLISLGLGALLATGLAVRTTGAGAITPVH